MKRLVAGFIFAICLSLTSCVIHSDYKILDAQALQNTEVVWVLEIRSDTQAMLDSMKTTLASELGKQGFRLSTDEGVLQIKIAGWIDYFYFYESDDTLRNDEISNFVIEVYKKSKKVLIINDGRVSKSSWQNHCESVIPRMVAALKKATE